MNKSDISLPPTWVKTTLGEIIEYGASQKAEPHEISNDTWVLELEDIERNTSKLLTRMTFVERQSKSTKNRFKAGDILYGKLRPYLNKVIVADKCGVCTTEIVPLRPTSLVIGSYLFYWLKHPAFLNYVASVSYGVNMPRLGTEAGRRAPFVLAPLAEQKRIADKLNTMLARVDACSERLNRIPLILKRFRQSVLAAAVSGVLSADWRNNLPHDPCNVITEIEKKENLRIGKLRVRGASAKLDPNILFDIPETWAWVSNHRLAEDSATAICAGPFGTIFKAKDFRESGVPIIFLRHVGEGKYLTHKPGFMDEKVWKENHQPYSVTGGELLVTKLGDPPGTACLYPKGLGVAMVTPDVMKMSVDEDVAHPAYLMHFFNSPSSKKMVSELAFGVTRLRIDLSMFKTFPIPLPPLAEQHEIVRRIDVLFEFAERLEARLSTACNTVERLTPALLAKAFRGELVPQDPNDEPATELLKRLASTREPAIKSKRSSKSVTPA